MDTEEAQGNAKEETAKAPEAQEAKAPAPKPAEAAPERTAAPAGREPYRGGRGRDDRDDRRRGRRRIEGGPGDAVLCRPLEVMVKDDRVEQAIRQLKNRLAREGVLRELKNRRHYFKPSELKRIKRREAARRRRKQARQRSRR
jgi:small subunit ribosomal protein S21